MTSRFIESNFNGSVKIKNRTVVRDSQGRLIAMGRNVVLSITDASRARSWHRRRLPYGARLHVDEGDSVKRGARLAQWDPYMRPILTEVDGVAGVCRIWWRAHRSKEQTDEVKRHDEPRDRRLASDAARCRSQARGRHQRVEGRQAVLQLARGVDARYQLPVDAILSIEPNAKVKAWRRAGAHLRCQRPQRRRDITGGLPRVAELFEARRPKDNARSLRRSRARSEFGKDYKNKQRITIKPDDANAEPVEYLIPRGKSLAVQHGDRIEKGDFVYDGHPAPHDILAIKGVEELANYLINEIQDVYRLQGVHHQRQAHRGDRAPNAAEGGDRGSGRDRPAQG